MSSKLITCQTSPKDPCRKLDICFFRRFYTWISVNSTLKITLLAETVSRINQPHECVNSETWNKKSVINQHLWIQTNMIAPNQNNNSFLGSVNCQHVHFIIFSNVDKLGLVISLYLSLLHLSWKSLDQLISFIRSLMLQSRSMLNFFLGCFFNTEDKRNDSWSPQSFMFCFHWKRLPLQQTPNNIDSDWNLESSTLE